MAAQLTLTSGHLALGLWSWMAEATSSLPVPLSPRMSTVASVGATVRMVSSTARMAGDEPIRRVALRSAWISSRSARFSSRSAWSSKRRRSVPSRRSVSTGFAR